MRKWMSTLLAIDFAICFCTMGSNETLDKVKNAVKPAKEVVERVESEIITEKGKMSNNPYLKEYLGEFSLTFYVADAKWGYQTATGVRSRHLQTCAVDPKIIPYGSTILLIGENNQQLVLKAVDCGGGIIGNKIDIFWDKSIKEGYNFMAEFGTISSVYLLEE